MIWLKKVLHNELIHLTILLSLLRLDPDTYLQLDNGIGVSEIVLGSSSAFLPTGLHNIHNRLDGYAHPKSLDRMLLRQDSLFYELNLLGRYNRFQHVDRPREITTYLLCGQEPLSAAADNDVENQSNESGSETSPSREELPNSEEDTPVGDGDDLQDEATGSTCSSFFANWGEMSKEVVGVLMGILCFYLVYFFIIYCSCHRFISFVLN